jgi:hypothetical protein
MKNLFPMILIGLLLLSGIGVNAYIIDNNNTILYPLNPLNLEENTHTVFVEIASSQTCPGCTTWNSVLIDVYESGNYDFEYVTMICFGTGGYDDILNTEAYDWKNFYDISATPTSILDGDFKRMAGSSTSTFLSRFQDCGQREVNDIDASMVLTWLDNATIQIDIEIENNEDSQYNGNIRIPISEIVSRYKTNNGDNFYYGFLDYLIPMNTEISIEPFGTYSNSVIWDGNDHQDNHGTNYGDITEDNIQVTLAVFNQENGYLDESLSRRIDQNLPPDKPIVSGPTEGIPGEEYLFTFVSSDPEDRNLSYFIEWNDGNPQGWIGPYESNQEIEIGHTFSADGFYQIKAKARDEDEIESYWSNPYNVMIGNIAPDSPIITGPKTGYVDSSYDYRFKTIDQNGDNIYYTEIDWGDGTNTGLMGPYSSGEEIILSHTWSEGGTFVIRAKAKDFLDHESDWGELEISMPRTRVSKNVFKLPWDYIFSNLVFYLKEMKNFYISL